MPPPGAVKPPEYYSTQERKIQFDLKREPPAREGGRPPCPGAEQPQGAVGGTLCTKPDPLTAPGWLLLSGGFITSGEEEGERKEKGGQASLPAASHKQPDLSRCLKWTRIQQHRTSLPMFLLQPATACCFSVNYAPTPSEEKEKSSDP